MILSRVTEHLKKQNWTAVLLDFIVVVVGVFIGLQANNWNVARADHARARVYLQQLLIDLEGDVNVGHLGVAESKLIDQDAETFITALEDAPGAREISDSDLLVAVPTAGYAYLPYGNRATYDEMISTGGLGLLHDTALKRVLAEYYSRQAAGRQWDSLLRNEQYAYRAAIRGILTRKQFAWARANAFKKAAERTPPPPFDREAFLRRARSRPGIINSLRSMGAVQQRLRDDSRDLSKDAEALAKRIQDALARDSA